MEASAWNADRRAADFDKRWTPLQTDWENFIGGKPSQPNPPAPNRPPVTATAELPPVELGCVLRCLADRVSVHAAPGQRQPG